MEQDVTTAHVYLVHDTEEVKACPSKVVRSGSQQQVQRHGVEHHGRDVHHQFVLHGHGKGVDVEAAAQQSAQNRNALEHSARVQILVCKLFRN
jgi:hypothetical protein